MLLHPSSGKPTFPLKTPSSMNMTHQGDCRCQTGSTEKLQVNGIKHFIPIKTRVANGYSIPQVHHQEITPPDSMVSLSMLISTSLTSFMTYMEQSSPSTAPPSPTQHPASPDSTSPGLVDSTPYPLLPGPHGPIPYYPKP